MTLRENLLHLLRRQGYETVPVEMMLCPSQIEHFNSLGKAESNFEDYYKIPWRRLPALVPDKDLRPVYQKYHCASGLMLEEIDEWGIGHRATSTSMHMTQMFHPLADIQSVRDIQAYPLPVYTQKNNNMLAKQAEALHSKGLASVGNMQCTVWETSWYIRGMENLMMDMISEDEKAQVLLDRVTEMSVQRAELYASAGVDILFLGDDVGMQQSLLMSEAMYTDWLKPRLKRVIDAARRIKPDIIVFYHSCGYVVPLIRHFIEAGIDVLNPVQPECMDFEEVYRMYGDKLSFHGTIGTQTTMPFETPEDIRRIVHRNLDIVGEKGGLLPAPTHLIEPEVPWENIEAYAEACRTYRSK